MERLSVPAASDCPSRKSSSAIARSRSGSIGSAVSSAESTAAVERWIAQQAAIHAYASQTNTPRGEECGEPAQGSAHRFSVPSIQVELSETVGSPDMGAQGASSAGNAFDYDNLAYEASR